jgi:hypothetical protein
MGTLGAPCWGTLMKRTLLVGLLLIGAFLQSSGTLATVSPKDLVNRYLNAIKSNDLPLQRKLFCVKPDGTLSDAHVYPPTVLGSWKILGEEVITLSPGFSYTSVIVKIEYEIWSINVWQTEKAYQYNAIPLRELGVQNSRIIQRNNWSSDPICIASTYPYKRKK